MVDKNAANHLGPKTAPKQDHIKSTDTEIVGNYWRAWRDGEGFFIEFDVGHFAPKFVTADIEEGEFWTLRKDSSFSQNLIKKYRETHAGRE